MQFTSLNFTCSSCGAPQRFSPTESSLICDFCHTKKAIEIDHTPIKEYNFQEALRTLNTEENKEIQKEVLCKKCGGHFQFTPYTFSSLCPFCQTPATIERIQEIQPQSLIPFQISQQEALSIFKEWVGSRWFAPDAFKKYLDTEEKLLGYYLPYWTYDSQTNTSYQGLRGDIYYVTVRKRIRDTNGNLREVNVQEARINWTPVSGEVTLSFDDITVGASKTITRAILESLEPWDTNQLLPFNEKYLAGFEAQEYTIGLDNGFEYAKVKMASSIQRAIKGQIGGDQQKITTSHTHYSQVSYKNTLFPIWTATFEWKEKSYLYAINAQTGKIVGERPYSYVKIGFAIITIASIIAGFIYFSEHQELFTQINNITYQ